jgi:SAM-dependent methyltransferase
MTGRRDTRAPGVDPAAAPSPGREISDTHVAELRRLDLSYWWYAVRIAHVEAALRSHAPGGALSLLDFGCGEGKVTERLIRDLEPRRALGLDGTRAAVEAARARGVPVAFADFRTPLSIDFEPDAITCLDVLEHLEAPADALRHLARASAPGALLVVTVPAHAWLYSRWDEVSGHRRRYSRAGLIRHLREGGWELLRVRYIFAYCVPQAWIERRLLKRVRDFEFPRVPRTLNRLLTLAGHLERRCGSPLPFGTSLLAVARREA